MLEHVVRHPSVQVSAGAVVVMAAASLVRPLPWPLWGVWAALAVISVAQAVRRER